MRGSALWPARYSLHRLQRTDQQGTGPGHRHSGLPDETGFGAGTGQGGAQGPG